MQILTVVLGLVFILLVLSLLATTIMELTSAVLHLRGKNLKKALNNMLIGLQKDGETEDKSILEKFKKNPLFRQLSFKYGKSSTNPPSYVSGKSFQSILFDVLLGDENLSESQIFEKIDELENEDLRRVLKQLLRESDGKLDAFKIKVEDWFDSVMERATGWYKRTTQKILIFVGIGIAVVLNADTLSIYEHLESDPETLAKVVAMAETMAVEGDSTSMHIQDGKSYEEAKADLDEINGTIDELRSPLGLGWKNSKFTEEGIWSYYALTRLVGWLITALAISLGAPFWFDILKKLVSIRSSGGKPE